MIAAGTDFYMASPENRNNQIEIEYDHRQKYNMAPMTSDTSKDIPHNYGKNNPCSNGDINNTFNTNCCAVIKNHTNPVFEDDSSETIDSAHTEVQQRCSTDVQQQRISDPDMFLNSDLRFGWKFISLQIFDIINRPIFFLIFLCLAGIAQGLIVTGISFTVLTSIEKQFGLKSSEVALFGTAYDTAYGICCVFVGYIGHSHKPRCIGWGMLIMTVGAVVLSIPKFVIGTYSAGLEHSTDFCQRNMTMTPDVCIEPKAWYYEFIFVVGNILIGIGATPLYTLAPAHLDDVSTRGQSSLYMGIYYAACALGPAIGFIIGLPVLDKWVDLDQPAGSKLTPASTSWVGAWWLGYLIGACMCLLPVLPLLGFPKEFPDSEAVRLSKRDLADTRKEDDNLKHDVKSVWPATKALLQNPQFIFISLAIACESLAIGGFSTFLPKFIQTQFHYTAGSSALYTGVIAVPGAAGGIFLGGYLIKRYEWNCKQVLRSAAVMAFISMLLVAFALVGCPGRKVVGQQKGSVAHTFINNCNRDCRCSTDYYKPVCSVEDQKTYYSPCHAGCFKGHSIDKKYYNCTCVASNVTHSVDGRCTGECKLFPLFCVGAIFLMFFTFMNNVPMLNATFRVVNEGQGSFAMGFQQIFVRFIGFIPAPIMFGSLIDKSCELWQTDSCTKKTQSCLEYEQAYFRYYMFALGVVTKFASFVFITLAYRTYKLPVNIPTPPSSPPVSTEMEDLAGVPNLQGTESANVNV